MLSVKAVLRKDFLQLWPVVALTAALLFVRNVSFPFLGPPTANLRTLIEVANGLACWTLLVAVIQQDALTGVRHDWFTRPIARGSLFAAKAIFIIVAITVPADLSLIAGSLLSGHSLSEALLEGAQFSLNWIAPLTILAAVAALSNTLLQAAAITLIAMAGAAILLPVSGAIGIGDNDVYGPGVGWIAESIYLLMLFVASAAVLWLQYARRSFRRAATLAAVAAVIAACGPGYITWGQVFAVQKLFSTADQEQKFQTTLAPGCFRPDELHIWGPNDLRRAGPDPIRFFTTIEDTVPAGGSLIVGPARLDYIDENGKTLARLSAPRASPPPRDPRRGTAGSRFDSHYWLLPRATYERLRTQKVHAHLTYSLSLLEPVTSADVLADDSRRYIEGLGFCGAKVGAPGADTRGRAIHADCLKYGPQPALLSAVVKGDPASEGFETSADFRPSLLELLSVRRSPLYVWSKQSGTPTVTLTAFEARAHVDRTFTVPGILGGEQCVP